MTGIASSSFRQGHAPRGRRSFLIGATALASAVSLSPATYAQNADFPNRDIAFVVPVAAGGNGDLVARIVAEGVTARLGRTVYVENVAGAGGLTGAQRVMRAKPDGYTVMLSFNALAINAALNPNSRIDYVKDFEHISQLTSSYVILVVPAKSPFNTLAELIEAARKAPGKLSYASTGVASGSHLSSELLKSEAGVDIVHVPYPGAPQATADLLAGRVDLFWLNPATALPLIASGQLRAIATAAPVKQAVTGDVPPIRNTLPRFELNNWLAVAGPKGMPRDIVARINAAIAAVIADPGYRSRLETLGVVPIASSPEEILKLTAEDTERWRVVAARAGIVLQ